MLSCILELEELVLSSGSKLQGIMVVDGLRRGMRFRASRNCRQDVEYAHICIFAQMYIAIYYYTYDYKIKMCIYIYNLLCTQLNRHG